jgi:hypothetical protein
MKGIILVLFALLIFNYSTLSQKRNTPNEVSISTSFIWYDVELIQGNGPLRDKKGNASSYGFNVNYSKTLLKHFFIVGGIGLNKQRFNVTRSIDYDDGTTGLLYSTSKYSYDCIHSLIGVGYNHFFKDNYLLKGSLTYNQFHTYRQQYALSFTPPPPGSNKIKADSKFLFGQSYNTSIGVRRFVGNSFSVGIDAILPVYTRWKKDRKFGENPNEYYSPKLSAGVNMSASINF